MLALPGVSGLMVLMFAARIPLTADSMVLTLHVVLGLHHGYGAAGLAGAIVTIGMALGAPVLGRLVDSIGLRWMLVIATIGDGAFWITAGRFSYPVLLVTAFVGGLLALPVMSIGRQAIAALVPEDQRRSAYSLDSISMEMSYMIGPALAVLVATRASTQTALLTVGVATVLSGIAIYLVNPRVRGADEHTDPSVARPLRRSWLRGPLISVLAINCGAVFVLAGVEVTVVAALRASGQVGWTGVATIAMCVASATGGVIYGAVRKAPGSAILLGLMSLLLIPVGLAGGQWWVLALVLAPTSMLCAPTLASTGEAVSKLAPVAVRGEAMGLHSSSLTLGAALGSPVIGTVVDRLGAPGGFYAAGLGGILIAALILIFGRQLPSGTSGTPTEPARETTSVAG
ncbi:MAG TPA: MFS transporter [Pseudonocardiaceae bacterium]|nr:MFS transporter [Pseudonocardiaceae bacterium]